MDLECEPELPFLPVGFLGPRNRKFELSVRLLPVDHGEAVQVLGRLAVGLRELEEPIFCLRVEGNELWQALDVHIFAHELALGLRAVDIGRELVELEDLARLVVKLSGHHVHKRH